MLTSMDYSKQANTVLSKIKDDDDDDDVLAGTSKEHLGFAVALGVPTFVVVTKVDACRSAQVERTLHQLERMLKGPGCRRVPLRVETEDDACTAASNFHSERCNVFIISRVTNTVERKRVLELACCLFHLSVGLSVWRVNCGKWLIGSGCCLGWWMGSVKNGCIRWGPHSQGKGRFQWFFFPLVWMAILSVFLKQNCIRLMHEHMHSHTTTHNHFTALWIFPGQPGWASIRRNIHTWTFIVVINHPLSASSIYYNPCILPIQFTCLTVFFHSLSATFFSLPLGLAPSTSYSTHFFTKSLSSLRRLWYYGCYVMCSGYVQYLQYRA